MQGTGSEPENSGVIGDELLHDDGTQVTPSLSKKDLFLLSN